jgi:hypothetical protein
LGTAFGRRIKARPHSRESLDEVGALLSRAEKTAPWPEPREFVFCEDHSRSDRGAGARGKVGGVNFGRSAEGRNSGENSKFGAQTFHNERYAPLQKVDLSQWLSLPSPKGGA